MSRGSLQGEEADSLDSSMQEPQECIINSKLNK